MANTIQRLWYGNLEPIRHLVCNRMDIKQLKNLMQRNIHKLGAGLDEKENEILEKYDGCVNEYCSLLAEQAFFDGFCLGVRMVTEAIGGAEGLLE